MSSFLVQDWADLRMTLPILVGSLPCHLASCTNMHSFDHRFRMSGKRILSLHAFSLILDSEQASIRISFRCSITVFLIVTYIELTAPTCTRFTLMCIPSRTLPTERPCCARSQFLMWNRPYRKDLRFRWLLVWRLLSVFKHALAHRSQLR